MERWLWILMMGLVGFSMQRYYPQKYETQLKVLQVQLDAAQAQIQRTQGELDTANHTLLSKQRDIDGLKAEKSMADQNVVSLMAKMKEMKNQKEAADSEEQIRKEAAAKLEQANAILAASPAKVPVVATLKDVQDAYGASGLKVVYENSRHSTWLPSPLRDLSQFETLADQSPRNVFSDWLNELLNLNDELAHTAQLIPVQRRLEANKLADRIKEVEDDYEAIAGLN